MSGLLCLTKKEDNADQSNTRDNPLKTNIPFVFQTAPHSKN